MNEKTKLLVFEKKEVFLIFVFVILVAITSFTIGIRIGKNYALKQSGITPGDVKNVAHLKSTEEEALESIANKEEAAHGAEGGHGEAPAHGAEAAHAEAPAAHATEAGHGEAPASHGEAAPAADAHGDSHGDAHASNPAEVSSHEKGADDTALKKLEDEFKKLDIEEKSTDSNKKKIIEASEHDTIQEKLKSAADVKPTKKEGAFKYTIQLGSYPTLQEAEKFADGFRIRGYNPIVYETTLQNKGIWYRVSLGSFDSMNEAKVYVQKEESLFAGQDYVITEMK